MAGNADEDRRRGEEKQKDEDGRGGEKKDVGGTGGGGKKKGNDPFSLKDLAKSLPGNVDRNPQVSDRNLRMPASRDMAGNADEDRRRGEEKQKGEDGRGGNKKDVGSTSGGGKKKGNDPFNLKDLAKSLPGKNPQLPDLNLRMPASSSENVAGDPTSGKSLPGNVASTTDILEKVDAGTRKRMPRVFNRVLWMPEKIANIDTSASRSENVAGDRSGTPTSSPENTASTVGGISLKRSSRLANPSGTPTSSSENTASEVEGISLRWTCKL